MSGLDRILEQIKRDSDASVKRIDDEAERTVRENVGRISEETRKAIENIKLETEVECKDIVQRGESSAALIKKRTMLNMKQNIINDMIKKAHQKLISLPCDEYFDTIERMINNNAHPGQRGEISFNEKDIARMPEAFKLKLQSISGGTLSLSNKKSNIDGGFILIYDEIEENCSFDAMFSEKHDEIQDRVCSILFS